MDTPFLSLPSPTHIRIEPKSPACVSFSGENPPALFKRPLLLLKTFQLQVLECIEEQSLRIILFAFEGFRAFVLGSERLNANSMRVS